MRILALERSVVHKLITFDIIPLVPYPGFERLFAADSGTTGDDH